MGNCVTAPMVTPEPKPMTAARGGLSSGRGVKEERHEADHDLRGHVVAVRRVDLAVVLERDRVCPLLDGDRGGGAVFVVLELGHRPVVHLDDLACDRHAEEPRREAQEVPTRQHEHEHEEHDGGDRAPHATLLGEQHEHETQRDGDERAAA